MIFRLSWNVLSAGTQGSVNVTGSSARVELPFKIPKGRTYSPPACGWWYCLRQPWLSEGDAASADAFSQCRPASGHVGHHLLDGAAENIFQGFLDICSRLNVIFL